MSDVAQAAGWQLVYHGFDPRQEGLREALCTLGNGFFATRGAAPEARADDVHYPGTYLAGCYNRLQSEVAGRDVWNEDLVNLPNWLPLTFRVEDGEWLDLRMVELLAYRQELNLASGVLSRSVRFRDGEGRETLLETARLVHMAEPHYAAQRMVLTPLNWSGSIELRTALDGTVTNSGVARYRGLNKRHLEPLRTAFLDDDTMLLKVRTTQSRIEVAQAARTLLTRGTDRVPAPRRTVEQPGYVAQEVPLAVGEGVPLSVEKVLALYTSRDAAISECGSAAEAAVTRAGSFDELFATHARAWKHLWRRFDIEVESGWGHDGSDEKAVREMRILRLHTFHLLQTASPNTMSLDAGVPARGLHGEAYRGHVFWDELFVFPLLNLRMPEITRGLLLYRFRRLGEARAAARRAGFRGAMFPWQSGSTGREETQELHLNPRSGRWITDRSHRQRHVNAAIAYNIWQYYQVTGDLEFLSFHGAEMLLEIARFWASIAAYDAERDRYDIRGVMGPDEYHDGYPDTDEPGIDNNAYTNIMASWTLCRAHEVLGLLPVDRARELREVLDLREEEYRRWEEISRKLRLVFADGILMQFEGYDNLRELDWAAYRRKYGDIHRLDRILEAEGDTANRYQMSKQADVLMLFYLFSGEELRELVERLGYRLEADAVPRTIEYYMSRTSHGSTLSRVVDSWVLARSNRAGSWKLFAEALESDVADIQGGTTQEGIHLGAMAGVVDIVQRCYTGLETRGDVLWLSPRIPEDVRRIGLNLHYRNHAIRLVITRDRVTVTSLPSAAGTIKIAVHGNVFELGPEETREFPMPRTLESFDALLVDLDGVITKTAAVHAAAWKQMFDDYLAQRAGGDGRAFEPFDLDRDYRTYVDGKRRYDGVRSFLASRGIALPEGTPDDPPDRETVCGLGNRKNEYFTDRLAQAGVESYQDAVALLRAARERGLRLAVVSSSENCLAVLRAAGLAELFPVRVDGAELARLGLPGKPAPDMFLEAARRLVVEPGRALVLEDAVSGVQAGKRGGFGMVVGVDRGEHADELRAHGADIVLRDLRELIPGAADRPRHALSALAEIRERLNGREPAVFLDYDGTLTPIVERPGLAVLSDAMRQTVRELADHCRVVIVSGRDRRDVERLVGVESLVYVGSHGFDISGPNGFEMQHPEGERHAAILRLALAELQHRLGHVQGILVEAKRYALAVHYRLASDEDAARADEVVEEVAQRHPQLRRTGGKKVFELRPRVPWDKGKAVLWLVQALDLDRPDVLPFYLGDDRTDEDAFAALEEKGIGILVGDAPADSSRARYRLRDPGEVGAFLQELTRLLPAFSHPHTRR